MKPCTVLVSACLLGQNVKYNGGNNHNAAVHAFLRGKQIILVCPEVLSGMPVPRPPVELCKGRVINKKGMDLTAIYQKGVDRVIQQIWLSSRLKVPPAETGKSTMEPFPITSFPVRGSWPQHSPNWAYPF